MKQKAFFMIFQGLSVPRNCLRPETAPLIMLAIKRGLLRNFAKNFKGRHFMGQSSTGLRFSITIGFFAQSLSKIPILDLKKRGHFFFQKFALCSKCRYFSIARFDILVFVICYISKLKNYTF